MHHSKFERDRIQRSNSNESFDHVRSQGIGAIQGLSGRVPIEPDFFLCSPFVQRSLSVRSWERPHAADWPSAPMEWQFCAPSEL
jgi:hypothetical protein